MGRYHAGSVRADCCHVYQRASDGEWRIMLEEGKGAGVTIPATTEDVHVIAEAFVDGLICGEEWDSLRDLADRILAALADNNEAMPVECDSCDGGSQPSAADEALTYMRGFAEKHGGRTCRSCDAPAYTGSDWCTPCRRGVAS